MRTTLKINIKPIIILGVLCVLVQACSSSRPNASNSQTCIQPLASFAFKTSADSNVQTPGSDFKTLPMASWKIEGVVPDQPVDVLVALGNSMIRHKGDHQEIWVSSPVHDEFNVFNTKTKKWSKVSKIVGDSNILASSPFVTSDGSIWATSNWHETPNVLPPLLSKYNEASGRFEFVDKTKELSATGSQVVLDTKDTFWILADDRGISSYNTIDGSIKNYISLPNIKVTDAKSAPDGSIYFVNRAALPNGIFKLEVYHFEPETNSLDQISTYEIDKTQTRSFSNLLIDRKGNLWLSDLGWMQPDGTWYAMLRSPVFLTNLVWTEGSSRWATPDILLESSDGLLWFRSDNGMTWLNPQKGEWCWFTTYQSNIIEDSDHHLWMIADGKLYKLAIPK